jgi:hypothetical protein
MDKTKIEEILTKDILEEMGVDTLSEDKKIILIEKMSDIVQKRLTIRLVEEMGEEQKDDFEKIADSPDKVADFLQESFPNFMGILQEEVAKVKKEMIEEFGEK